MKTFFIKSIRQFLRWWAKKGIAPGILHQIVDQHAAKLHTKPLLRQISGRNYLFCDLRDHVESRIYFFGAYEPIEAFLFCSLVQPDMHIVDAGANIGFYSLLLSSKLSDRGRVFAFEPVPVNLEKLKSNIAQSGRTKIDVIENGLWDKEDTLKFSLDSAHGDNAGSYTAGKTDEEGIAFECPVRSMDSYLDDGTIPKVDLIKMDIEGAELFALKGAAQVLDLYQPTILMEINQQACARFGYRSEEIDNILLPKGYKIFRIESLPQNSGFIESTKNIIQSNVLFLSPKDLDRFQPSWDYKKVKRAFANNKM